MTDFHHKPQPHFSSAARALCPVCGMPSYSSSGTHPQCAMLAADVPHIRRIQEQKAAVSPTPKKQLRRYEKLCPKCGTVQHVRKRTCECGYVLQVVDRPEGQ